MVQNAVRRRRRRRRLASRRRRRRRTLMSTERNSTVVEVECRFASGSSSVGLAAVVGDVDLLVVVVLCGT